MEAAGLIVGVVPLVIAALKCFKSGKQLSDLVRKRKRHIETLIRALQSYNGYLELLSRWLLISMDICLETDDHNFPFLMQNAEMNEKMREFLGTEPSAAFHNAIEKGRGAVDKITENIDDLLPGNQSTALALKAITLKGPADIEVRFRKGIKLTLRKEEIDQQVDILNASADDLARLHNVSASLQQMNISPSPNTSRKLANSLDRVRGYAVQLYTAISLGWSPGCHSAHEAKLVLEDRIEEKSSHKGQLRKQNHSLRFQVVFASEPSAEPSGGSEVLWHESEINIVDDGEQNENNIPFHHDSTQKPSIKVNFPALPPISAALPITTEVQDICLTIREAKREQKKLQLYLHTHHRFRCHHSPKPGICSLSAAATKTINLETLLSTSTQPVDQSKRMPLLSRLRLALNLSSTLLQLKATPWLATLWSKSTVCYFAPSSLSDHSQIDLTRPLISVKFGSGPQITDHKEFSEARRVILELGIMLLELWHETTFEAHCNTLRVTAGKDYHDRVKWAQKWLENSSNLLLPDYHDLVAHCIRCDFANNAFENQLCLNPSWENERLIQGFIAGVVEPLRKMCRGSRN